jgi:hypothetical protein
VLVAIALVHLIEKDSRQIVRRSVKFRHEPPSQWNETSRGRDGECKCRSWRIAICPSDAGEDNSDTSNLNDADF